MSHKWQSMRGQRRLIPRPKTKNKILLLLLIAKKSNYLISRFNEKFSGVLSIFNRFLQSVKQILFLFLSINSAFTDSLSFRSCLPHNLVCTWKVKTNSSFLFSTNSHCIAYNRCPFENLLNCILLVINEFGPKIWDEQPSQSCII